MCIYIYIFIYTYIDAQHETELDDFKDNCQGCAVGVQQIYALCYLALVMCTEFYRNKLFPRSFLTVLLKYYSLLLKQFKELWGSYIYSSNLTNSIVRN